MPNKLTAVVALWAAALVVLTLLIPALLVNRIEPDLAIAAPQHNESHTDNIQLEQPSRTDISNADITIPVYLTTEERIDTVPLEQYVRGVLAAEMPIDFELEALKAQAIAARTYVWRRLIEEDSSHVPVEGALVTDGVAHQVYYPEHKLAQLWAPTDYEDNMRKLNQAIEETSGLIITYDGRPINATFFSTSNGYTENSEDYWDITLPYLRSVPSPWDVDISPRYEETVTIPAQTVYRKLGIDSPISKQTKAQQPLYTIVEKTAGQRIKTVIIANQTFTGREVREKLELNSSQFTLEQVGDDIIFTTFGYGHGVGMSQWGANGMAMAGSSAQEIITHYYQGITIEKIVFSQNI